MSECETKAKDIVYAYLADRVRGVPDADFQMEQRIATALLAEREKVAAKFAAFADEKGEPISLPLTADGKVARFGETHWTIKRTPVLDGITIVGWTTTVEEVALESTWTSDGCEGAYVCNPAICYSTKEAAAEAAKEKKS